MYLQGSNGETEIGNRLMYMGRGVMERVKAMPKDAQTTTQSHSSHTLAKHCSKFSTQLFSNTWTVNFQMFKLVLCDPMDCSMPGFSVHHYLSEFTQTDVHWVSDAIQPSHPLLFPSSPAPFPASGSFQMSQLSVSGGQNIGVSASTSVPLRTPRTDLL